MRKLKNFSNFSTTLILISISFSLCYKSNLDLKYDPKVNLILSDYSFIKNPFNYKNYSHPLKEYPKIILSIN